MSNLDEPAYPFTPNQQMKLDDGTWDQNTDYGEPGLTKLERACIDLRIPATGDDELDALIARAERRDLAAKAMEGLAADPTSGEITLDELVHACRKDADALLAELAKEAT